MTWSHDYVPREQHEYMLELVRRDHGGALPDWFIQADLVYLADLAQHPSRPQAFPGRRRLEQRWGVSERVARRNLAAPEWQEKCEVAKIRPPERKLDGPERPRLRPTSVPATVPPASPPGTDEAPESSESVPGAVPATVPPASPPTSTRAEIGPTVLRSYGPTEETTETSAPAAPRSPPPPDTSYDEAAAYLGQVVNLAVGKRPSAGPDRSSKPGQALLKAVRRDKVLVLDAMRYVAEGEGEHAEFLRGRGTGLETILRHLDEYAERWRNPARPQHRARGSPDRSSPGDGFFAEMLDERTGRLNPRGDVIDAD